MGFVKFLVLLLLSVVLLFCNINKDGPLDKKKEYAFNELTVNFIRNTRVTTFIENGKPISGIVTQKRNNGGKNTWEVEKGLAVKQTRYYANGQIERVLEMKNGVEHGKFFMFYSDGSKHVEQYYDEGKPIGTWHHWNKKGELIETIEH